MIKTINNDSDVLKTLKLPMQVLNTTMAKYERPSVSVHNKHDLFI